MTRHNNISQEIFRMATLRHAILRIAFCLAFVFCIAQNAVAQTSEVWNGTSKSTALAGRGTEKEPFLISSGADLKYLQGNLTADNKTLWDKGYYFLQTCDIDLGGNVLGMIGVGKDKPFKGVYDGGGNAIKNLKVDWSSVNTTDLMSFGLFGFLKGATVKNLQIDNALVTRDKQVGGSIDGIRIGVLAGTVSPSTTIQNIAIHNSKVEDYGVTTSFKAAFIGGVVGSIASDFSAIQAITAKMGNITIHNVYAQVDFDLSKSTPGDKNQLNIGGIVGRLRRPKYSDIPLYILYEGNINAPWGTVGPVFGSSRSGKGSDPGEEKPGDCYNAYTGEIVTYATEIAATASETEDVEYLDTQFEYNGETIYPDRNRYFGKYVINKATVDADNPKYNTYRTRKARTLGNSNTLAYSNTDYMRNYQGVNRGTFADMSVSDTRQKVLEMLNSEPDGNTKFIWNKDEEYVELQNQTDIALLQRTSMHTFGAYLQKADPNKTYTYKWILSDAEGVKCTAVINSNQTTLTEGVLKVSDTDNYKSFCSIVGNFYLYNRIVFEVWDGANLVASKKYEMGDLHINILHDVYTTSKTEKETIKDDEGNDIEVDVEIVTKDHFLFRADVEIEGHHYAEEPSFFGSGTNPLSFTWYVYDDGLKELSASQYDASTTVGTRAATQEYEAHVKSTYVGKLQLTVSGKDPEEDALYLTQSVVDDQPENYIQHEVKGLQLAVTMEEYCGTETVGGVTIYKTQAFDPSHYHINATIPNPEESEATRYNPKDGFYDNVYKNDATKYDPNGKITEISDATKIKPLIFRIKVVDQFGNEWTSAQEALSRFRVQWNYRISGEGNSAEHTSPTYDDVGGKEDGNYLKVNGRYKFDSTKPEGSRDRYGLDIDVPITSTKNYNNMTGQYQLIGDSIFIIHPNILHRTSAFWVRARLFDIVNDKNGDHPTETVVSFNQLGIKLEKKENNTLYGKVVWRLDESETPYWSKSSNCDLTWYSTDNPTDSTSWKRIDEYSNIDVPSREIELPNYDPKLYYKLKYKSGSDLEAEQIIGPQNVVYVYDRAQTIANINLTGFNPYDQISNQYYPTGLLTNHGHDPYHAVATMEQAYNLLDANGNAKDNVVVVMGYLEDNDYLLMLNDEGVTRKPNPNYKRNATITGKNGNIKGSTLWLTGDKDGHDNEANVKIRGLNGATIFKDIDLYGKNGKTGNSLIFYCNLYDVTFDTGVRMIGYPALAKNKNGLGDYQATDITVVAGHHDYNKAGNLEYPNKSNAEQNKTTMKFYSGSFARIIAGARNNKNNTTTNNIFGNPAFPHRVKVVVDIKEEQDWNTYDYDIGLLVGGQTDGSLFAESEITMESGSVGRYISGNISYGRKVSDGSPADSFYGSTTLTLKNGGLIKDLYGGTLGRHEPSDTNATTYCDAYFYGRSIINIEGGTIENNIYGAGAGGVTGIGDSKHHTEDKLIPYYDGSGNLNYGSYENIVKVAGYKIPTMTLSKADDKLDEDENHKHKVLNFANSYVEVNIKGGTINGNIYGGGYGHSVNIPVERALEQAGWLFGDCTVNINGGTINGNIYGGGEGSDEFNKLNTSKFKEVACVFGNATVNISGGTITGNVYGGGKGVEGFPYMAKVTGNTSVNISGGQINGTVDNGKASGGHVYGGASLGEIRGNTHVQLDGGYVGGNVFGGSEGIASRPYMAIVYGKTGVTLGYKDAEGKYVGSAEVNASIYGGCNVSSIRKPTVKPSDLTDEQFANFGKGAELTEATDYERYESMTKVILNGGEIGNNVYGGSRGDVTGAGSETVIEGDTYVRINGGNYKNIYYLTNIKNEAVLDSNGKKRYRDFNIFGGGERKCTVEGTSHLDVRSGLMDISGMRDLEQVPDGDEDAENKVSDEDVLIFIPNEENENAQIEDITTRFTGPYMDLTYRRFALYGGGYGEKTNCLNTDVYVNIPTTKRKPHGRTLRVPYDHQSYFDIAGGGYSGDVGYWAKEVETDKWINVDSLPAYYSSFPTTDAKYKEDYKVVPEDYEKYVGGDCNVTIDGYTYCRKVIGGGFYGSCNTTNTKIRSGSLHQVYGGSLLGYVHGRAKLEIGSQAEEFLPTGTTMATATDVEKTDAYAQAHALNQYIYITENVYGGNDVKGIIGTTLWKSRVGDEYGKDREDEGPLWMTDVTDDSEANGIVMNIYGGRFMGDVYGAGNGHYRGYYVPGWLRYEDGPSRMYRLVKDTIGNPCPENPTADDLKRHRVYRARPMVGNVNINLRGNDENDFIKIDGNFYGGGRECTIGQWRTILPFEDPRRLSQGGHLHVNVGGYIYFGYEDDRSTLKKLYPDRHDYGNFYMGVEGRLYAEQSTLPAGIDLKTFDGSKTKNLATIGEAAYDHWYLKVFSDNTKSYVPGFPAPGETDGNFNMTGEHMFRGYMKNIEMQGDVELTFYRDLYTDPLNPNNPPARRRWLAGERALNPTLGYDATNITMNSFFLGGKCGSMTNNNLMRFCYTDNVGYDNSKLDNLPENVTEFTDDNGKKHDIERFGSIYRITMPAGVTIKNKLVMGAEDATTKIYPYNANYTDFVKTRTETKTEKGQEVQVEVDNANYVFEGGMVTQSAYSFDYIAYNLYMMGLIKEVKHDKDLDFNNVVRVPDDFYTNATYADLRSADELTVLKVNENGTRSDDFKIYRKNFLLGVGDKTASGHDVTEARFGLAITKDSDGKEHAYIGHRGARTPDGRNNLTVSKLTAGCVFDPQEMDPDAAAKAVLDNGGELPYGGNELLYGGIIYGGCYNSGVITGDIILNVGSDMLGNRIPHNVGGGNVEHSEHEQWFGELSRLKYYVGRVYGGGYGKDSRVDGDTYVNLLRNVQAMNVFGGGMQGDVTGSTHVTYIGSEKKSFIYGAIYGGGLEGSVGTNGVTTLGGNATNVELYSGNVDKVYGGSCMGNLYGSANIYLSDAITDDLEHLDYNKYSQHVETDWSGSRLVVGSVFGGNDISGTIEYTRPETVKRKDGNTDVERDITESDPEYYSVYVLAKEESNKKNTNGAGQGGSGGSAPQHAPVGPGKTSPGSDSENGYNGFPLIGNVYAGSNGNYGLHSEGSDKYLHQLSDDPTKNEEPREFATGKLISYKEDNKLKNIVDVKTVYLSGYDKDQNAVVADNAYDVPHVETAFLDIQGGTIVNAYGGGDMSTVTEKNRISINYPADNLIARAGFESLDEVMRVWDVCHISGWEQVNEALTLIEEKDIVDNMTMKPGDYIFDNQVFRVFGGNNNADMDIQPTWNLERGFVGSVYSGGNFGKMTYYNSTPDTSSDDDYKKYKGLTLAINSRAFHAEAVYGGGRVGDIKAFDKTTNNDGVFADDDPKTPANEAEYGATLHIVDGVIDHVYGGNDVSGVVHNGTHVIIEGAISGDVYCAGNGNYRYQYDKDDAEHPVTKITERYTAGSGENAKKEDRYFVLPRDNSLLKLDAQTNKYKTSDADKIKAINKYRPNVDRALMTIAGKDANNVAYVRGNVYCGGNSAAVSVGNDKINNGVLSDIKFEIGDNVVLNGVFLGSNGEALVDVNTIKTFEELNGLNLTGDSNETDPLYPHLLDIYMQAVEAKGLPNGFSLKEDAHNAYIGDFFVGGNRGSMMTDQTIDLTFPEDLVIYGRIVGGSQEANMEYTNGKTVTHYGGLNMPLAEGLKEKVKLTIKSKFEPWSLEYPINGDITQIQRKLSHVVKPNAKGVNEDGFDRWTCNIYGGCFKSGRTVGDISIDLYSDMLAEPKAGSALAEAFSEVTGVGGATLDKKQMIINGINRTGEEQWRTFSLVGGGFGRGTEVYGDIHLRMLPTVNNSGEGVHHPSTAVVFGGSQEGLVVGNTTVELRDGTVLANLYGASEATPMYGSSQVIIGWPEYYTCNTAGTYQITRVDNELSKAAKGNWLKNSVSFRKGDIVAKKVVEAMAAADQSKFTLVAETPAKLGTGITWDAIDIHVGDPSSLTDPNKLFYGHGNVYGGGCNAASATGEMLGKNTVCSFPAHDADNNTLDTRLYKSEWAGRGGNSTILVWDNKENKDLTWTSGKSASNADLKDHITIGTGKYVTVAMKAGSDVINKFKVEGGKYVQQSSNVLTADDNTSYYELKSDGGIYGDGRKVDVEGLRVCDIAYYGYAGHTPQYPLLLNTVQRLDMLNVEDCCLRLHGAKDLVANSDEDQSLYSLTRIGELQMTSSIADDAALNPGTRPAATEDNYMRNIIHDTPRIRNFVGLGFGTLYLGAIKSSVNFDTGRYHYPSGNLTAKTEDAENFSEIYSTDPLTYKTFKAERIHKYYKNYAFKAGEYDKDDTYKDAFDQRNMGTAANMIGITNSYSLKVEGLATNPTTGKEGTYYGPAYGVFEVKLLTLSPDEGGGYIYALNNHNQEGNQWHFLETTGNFVFPGACYTSSNTAKMNYISDDCFKVGSGFDTFIKKDDTDETKYVSTSPNEEAKEHYWYVNGSKFYYNVVLSAFTGNETKSPFILDPKSQNIYLYNVDKTTTFSVESITWERSKNTDGDIQNLDKAYNLFLSVGDKSGKAHNLDDSNTDNATEFVAQVLRENYSSGTYSGGLNNKYGAKDANTPLLGVTLEDKVDNSAKEYYNLHLKEPEKVRVTLKGTGSSTNTYYIDLTIHYMLSPIITGNIIIENCALPGEYIYANSFGVNIEKDDNITIDGIDWYIVPGGTAANYRISDASGASGSLNTNAINSDIANNVTEKIYNVNNLQFSSLDNSQLHIPAYRYMNGWDLLYRITAMGNHYFVETSSDKTDLTKFADKPFKQHIEVHNYHRMSDVLKEKLVLSDGARIYIEDNADMEAFYTWLASCQSAATTTNGVAVNPQYGAGTMVFLNTDVTVPDNIVMATDLAFAGTFYGNGHTVTMGNNTKFLPTNSGIFYNTGFVFNKKKTSASVTSDAFGDGTGSLQNCFVYYNDTKDGKVWLNNKEEQSASAADFAYGKVAYDLNGFYLEKRKGNTVDIIDAIYADGEYRYAGFSLKGADREALRVVSEITDDVNKAKPNYLDARGVIVVGRTKDDFNKGKTGFDATMHNGIYDDDPGIGTRAIYNKVDGKDVFSGTYAPIDKQDGADDYKFFGQNIAAAAVPSLLIAYNYETNRVYRASGFNGSKNDVGFHFNKAANALQPTLTAIDLKGHLNSTDAQGYAMMDMPTDGLASFGIADDITHNLLIYDDGNVPLTDASIKPDYKDCSEDDVNVHIIDKDKKIAYFHLVDKHDFNAPIDFDVTNRVWYERTPEFYSSGNNAWEGLCLPFTVKDVTASVNGKITHFYGTDEEDSFVQDGTKVQRSHEYWLRKFVKAEYDKQQDVTTLYFSRPASDKDKSAKNVLEDYVSYDYHNTFFEGLKGYEHNHQPQYMTGTTGATYSTYRPITTGFPYLVSFPGSRYYEFDLSGQNITYENSNVNIPVSDDVMRTFTHDGYDFMGTFSHVPEAENIVAPFTKIVDKNNDNECDRDANDVYDLLNTSFKAQEVLPFRTYITSSASLRNIVIGGTRAIDEEEQEEKYSGVNLFVRGSDVVITSDHEFQCPLYGYSGSLYRMLNVKAGENVYKNLPSGVYIALGKKFVLRSK